MILQNLASVTYEQHLFVETVLQIRWIYQPTDHYLPLVHRHEFVLVCLLDLNCHHIGLVGIDQVNLSE